MPIAWSSYGQTNLETDSIDSEVTITLAVAHNIQRRLIDCKLMEQQYEQANIKITSLQRIVLQTEGKVEDYKRYSLKLETEYRKKKRQAFVFKIAIPVALAGGFILGSR